MDINKIFPFSEYLNSLTAISIKGAAADDAARTFYSLGARNYFFRLEALSRIFRDTIDENDFDKLYKSFKVAEDVLGQYDFNVGLMKDFSQTSGLPKDFTAELLLTENTSAEELVHFLKNEKWLPDASKNTEKAQVVFEKNTRIDYKEYKSTFSEFLITTLRKIEKGYRSGKLSTTALESGIHELRRKLRWISLYAQVSGGAVQLTKNKKVAGEYTPYLTPAIVTSEFMKMTSLPREIEPVNIRFENFAALSWFINELGILKDAGLKIETIEKICQHDKNQISKQDILKKVNPEYKSLEVIYEKATTIAHTFFVKDEILSRIADDIQQLKH